MAKKDRDAYLHKFYKEYNFFLKGHLSRLWISRESIQILKTVDFQVSSLEEYIARCRPEQKDIYYNENKQNARRNNDNHHARRRPKNGKASRLCWTKSPAQLDGEAKAAMIAEINASFENQKAMHLDKGLLLTADVVFLFVQWLANLDFPVPLHALGICLKIKS